MESSIDFEILNSKGGDSETETMNSVSGFENYFSWANLDNYLEAKHDLNITSKYTITKLKHYTKTWNKSWATFI